MRKTMVLFCILAVLVLAVSGCNKETPAPAAPEPAAPEPVAPEPVVTAPVAPEAPTEYAGETDVISDVSCVSEKIRGTLTNTAAQAVKLGTDMKVLIRGMNVKTLECDSMELQPGESTTCSALNGAYPVVSGVNKVTVRLLEAKDVIAEVTCE